MASDIDDPMDDAGHRPAGGSNDVSAPVSPVSGRTLRDYDRCAGAFWQGTRDHDVSQNLDALLRHANARPPLAILDFGCGPGRDLAALAALGHAPIGLDGSPRFVEMARAHGGCEVWLQDFLALDLPTERFDGVFANASLFHVPSADLSPVLGQLRRTLRPGGVLFSSNPRGNGEEGWNGDRYGVYHDLAGWRRHLTEAGFVELEHYYRPPGLPRERQPWLATVWRRPRA
jgi:SAM-dependent methyltransferase